MEGAIEELQRIWSLVTESLKSEIKQKSNAKENAGETVIEWLEDSRLPELEDEETASFQSWPIFPAM